MIVALVVGASPALLLAEPGLPVTAFEIRVPDGWSPPRSLGSLVSLELGEPVDPERLRESVRSLRAAVEASEVEAHLLRTGDGVEVIFALWTQVRVAEVRLTGEPCLRLSRIRALIEQRDAAPLSESRLLRGLYRIQDDHREAGYFEARIRLEVDFGETGEAIVGYSFDCGPPATVESVVFEGDRGPFPTAALIERLAVGPEARLWQSLVSRDASDLEDWLVGQGHRLARVAEPDVVYQGAGSARVDLRYQIDVGPLFEVRVSGVDEAALERAGVLPLQGRERFDEAVLLRDLDRLRSHLQRLGHYRAQVSTRRERSENLRRIWILVEPGPVYELQEVVWEPMTAISESRLQTLVTTTGRKRFGGNVRLVDESLEQDMAAVRSALALRGFDRAQVGPPIVTESGSRLALRVPVTEGPQRRLVHLDFRGLEALEESAARSLMRLTEGGPFHAILLEDSLNALRARYEQLGFTRIQVSAAVAWNDDATLADVEIQVLEGPRTVVERVILRGNRRTATQPLLRAAGLETGEKVSRGDLLRVQRRLYALGIFSSVDVRLAPGAPLSGRRDVLIRVEEGKTRRVSYGVGWDSEDGLRALVGYSHGNLFGRAVSGRIDLRWSEREQLARALLHQPFLGRYDMPTTASLFAVEELVESFVSKRSGFQFETSLSTGSASRLNLLYTYKLVDVVPEASLAALDPADLSRVLDIDRDLQEVALSSLRPAWLIDRRDDPVKPRSGWNSTLSIESAFPFLETDAEFVKSFSQQALYVDLGPAGVAVGSVRLGAIEPTGSDAGVPGSLPSRLVPISERFFAGGRSTHRAYRRDRLGIPGDTLIEGDDGGLVAVGGNGLALFNLDWRFPIAGPIGGVLFADAGNVWSDWRDIDPDRLKPGVGVGLRYDSPIGPLRLEVGWKLDREPSESPAVVFLSFGNPF